MTEASPKRSDLGVRTLSAIAMIAIAGCALWLGGLVWLSFVVVITFGVLWEWRGLAARTTTSPTKRGLWNAAGLAYVGFATWTLISLRVGENGLANVLQIVSAVIATDIGAYFAGRTIGGPKIAPKISPSKTWAGLAGGMIASAVVVIAWGAQIRSQAFGPTQFDANEFVQNLAPSAWFYGVIGAFIAVLAQAGDFFESWMKRRAGLKDSGQLIPGHGGLFDRLDGLLAVSFVLGILVLLSDVFPGIS